MTWRVEEVMMEDAVEIEGMQVVEEVMVEKMMDGEEVMVEDMMQVAVPCRDHWFENGVSAG